MGIHNVIQYFVNIPSSSWWGLLGVMSSSAGLSIVIELLKVPIKKVETRYGVETKKCIVVLLGALSFIISTAADYINSNGQSLGNVGNHAAWIMAVAVGIYHFGGSQVYNNIRSFLQDISTYLDTGKLPDGNPKS